MHIVNLRINLVRFCQIFAIGCWKANIVLKKSSINKLINKLDIEYKKIEVTQSKRVTL